MLSYFEPVTRRIRSLGPGRSARIRSGGRPGLYARTRDEAFRFGRNTLIVVTGPESATAQQATVRWGIPQTDFRTAPARSVRLGPMSGSLTLEGRGPRVQTDTLLGSQHGRQASFTSGSAPGSEHPAPSLRASSGTGSSQIQAWTSTPGAPPGGAAEVLIRGWDTLVSHSRYRLPRNLDDLRILVKRMTTKVAHIELLKK
jgi:hypothetical protein